MNIEKRFLEVLSVRELEPNSVGTYLSLLRNFMGYCQKNDLNPTEFETKDLISYIAQINSASMKRQAIGMIKTLYEFVFGQGFKTYGIPYPKRKFYLPEYLTPFELNQVFDQIKNKKQLTIVKLQYACAMRVHEVVKVKRSDFIKKFDVRENKFVYDLRIEGKGSSVREIPVPDETINELFSYWQCLKIKPKEYLFQGQFAEYYSSRSVQIVMRRAMKKLRINKYHSTHILRHSKASHLAQANVDIKLIQELLGHKNIKTTEIYTHVKTSHIRIAFNAAEQFIQQAIELEKKLLKQA